MKEIIIHLLGGYTKKELDHSHSMGELDAAMQLTKIAESINGCSAEEWCQTIWKALVEKAYQNGTEGMA